MKVYCEAWINDPAQEYLMNLVCQGYYGEAWDFKMKLLSAFDNSLDYIIGSTFNSELEKMKEDNTILNKEEDK